MKPARFSLAAYGFALLMIFQSTGWMLLWKGMQWQAHYQAKTALNQHQHQAEAVFHHQDFQALKVGRKEIHWNGQLYDFKILSSAASPDSIRVALYPDHFEQNLYKFLGTAMSVRKDSDSAPQHSLAYWAAHLIAVAFLPPPAISLPTPPEVARQSRPVSPGLLLAQHAPGQCSPPPKA